METTLIIFTKSNRIDSLSTYASPIHSPSSSQPIYYHPHRKCLFCAKGSPDKIPHRSHHIFYPLSVSSMSPSVTFFPTTLTVAHCCCLSESPYVGDINLCEFHNSASFISALLYYFVFMCMPSSFCHNCL